MNAPSKQYDCLGNKLKVSDHVCLTEIPESLLADLPEEDQLAIKNLLNKIFTVQAFDESGKLELEYIYPAGSKDYSRTIWIAPEYVTKT